MQKKTVFIYCARRVLMWYNINVGYCKVFDKKVASNMTAASLLLIIINNYIMMWFYFTRSKRGWKKKNLGNILQRHTLKHSVTAVKKKKKVEKPLMIHEINMAHPLILRPSHNLFLAKPLDCNLNLSLF